MTDQQSDSDAPVVLYPMLRGYVLWLLDRDPGYARQLLEHYKRTATADQDSPE